MLSIWSAGCRRRCEQYFNTVHNRSHGPLGANLPASWQRGKRRLRVHVACCDTRQDIYAAGQAAGARRAYGSNLMPKTVTTHTMEEFSHRITVLPSCALSQ